ncbi:hypothetical protein [Chamaesiphon minutus]|uniref:FG-GAP repeat protein n=1 Tax=Chamaesiphon minutus (strain ATCC 27169 / PCC 6605) TaxID=1173020 RepID=K9US34_CHAP6|nr:hypothetical protein [Chamaesiphon minutus]AFY97251.1 FG-GAP repeat protein [Chamaesiphon minutus PCC 6605]
MKSRKLPLFIGIIGSLVAVNTCFSAYVLNISAKGKVIENFIPAGWTLEDRTAGDLNGDSKDDLALRLVKSGEPGDRPQSLVILLNTKNGLTTPLRHKITMG